MISDYDIERVAILMCEELGLNPYVYVLVKQSDVFAPTDSCYGSYIFEDAPQIYHPTNGDPPYEIRNSTRPTEPIVNEPRWRTFRADAAKALAGWRAVHKYMLIEG